MRMVVFERSLNRSIYPIKKRKGNGQITLPRLIKKSDIIMFNANGLYSERHMLLYDLICTKCIQTYFLKKHQDLNIPRSSKNNLIIQGESLFRGKDQMELFLT